MTYAQAHNGIVNHGTSVAALKAKVWDRLMTTCEVKEFSMHAALTVEKACKKWLDSKAGRSHIKHDMVEMNVKVLTAYLDGKIDEPVVY